MEDAVKAEDLKSYMKLTATDIYLSIGKKRQNYWTVDPDSTAINDFDLHCQM